MDRDRVSDRDRLERDEQGRIRGDSRGGGEQSQRPRKEKGKWKGKVLLLAVLALAVLLFMGLGKTQDVGSLIRGWSMTNQQGVVEIFNSVQEVEDINKRLGEERGVLDRDRLYHDTYIEEMVAKEYLVYVFTGDEEKDKEFTDWVAENHDTVQVFKIKSDLIENNLEVLSYIEDGGDEPMVLIYNEVERGKKNLEGVIKDPELLDEAKEYIHKIIESKG